ncbi:hypothetical protein ABZT06_50550, partial [Streptomyces sp. NPDC005483]|uniref:hypothetical protein n=1 Tax=Streptomyces sp. NPDC005483 TaxID=3154882 RepID=UPI0033AE0496
PPHQQAVRIAPHVLNPTTPPSTDIRGGVVPEEDHYKAFTEWFRIPGNENSYPLQTETFPIQSTRKGKLVKIQIGPFVKDLRGSGLVLSDRLRELFLANQWQLREEGLRWKAESAGRFAERRMLAAFEAFFEVNNAFPTATRKRFLVWGEDLGSFVDNISHTGRVSHDIGLREFLERNGAVTRDLPGNKWRVSSWPPNSVSPSKATPVTAAPPAWWPGRSRYLTPGPGSAASAAQPDHSMPTQAEMTAAAAAYEAIAEHGLSSSSADQYVAYYLWFQRPENENNIPDRGARFPVFNPHAGQVRQVPIGTLVESLRDSGLHLNDPLRDLLRKHHWPLIEETLPNGFSHWRLESSGAWADRKYTAAFAAFLAANEENFPFLSKVPTVVWGERISFIRQTLTNTGRKEYHAGLRQFLEAHGVETVDIGEGKWKVTRWPSSVSATDAKPVTEAPPVWWPGRSLYLGGAGGGGRAEEVEAES